MARKNQPKSKAVATSAMAVTNAAVAPHTYGDIVSRQHERQLELLRSVYHEAPQAVWQSAATHALEVNALLMAAVVGEQHRSAQEQSRRLKQSERKESETMSVDESGSNDEGGSNDDAEEEDDDDEDKEDKEDEEDDTNDFDATDDEEDKEDDEDYADDE